MFKLHTRCRACGSEKLKSVFDLGVSPLANDFKTETEDRAGYVPLKVSFCLNCGLAQLSTVVDPAILYRNYPYETSKSQTLKTHFTNLWRAIRSQNEIENVIEIGSNDGAFLQFAKSNGAEAVVGIDAAENMASSANQAGIRTVVGVLDNHTSDVASRIVPVANVIIARHVFCHVDDWQKFMANLDSMANRETLVVIEVPYVVDTLERTEWDQIYHEHLSYLSLKAMSALLDSTAMRLQSVMRFPIHGGSIALFIRRRDWKGNADSSVAKFLVKEQVTPDVWANFSARASGEIDGLKDFVYRENRRGKKVVGFGASAKSTGWVSACHFDKNDIAYICDSTPWKQGKFSPGSDIPIVPESQFTNETADVAICFAWNFIDEIKKKNAAWISAGGQFINPHTLI